MRTIKWKPLDPSLLRALLLALVFLAGALAGHLCAVSWDVSAQNAMSGYLADYCSVYDMGGVTVSLGSCIALYFSYVTLAFLLGFASVGIVLIPLVSGIFGFLTMYTISGFVCCFGRPGVVLVMGALAVRLLFTLPCFFAMAGAAWPLSTELSMLSFGHGRRSAPVLYGSRYFLIFGLCVVILAVGVSCERLLTPLLFRMALESAAL